MCIFYAQVLCYLCHIRSGNGYFGIGFLQWGKIIIFGEDKMRPGKGCHRNRV